MPVASEVGRVGGHHDEMAGAGLDPLVAPWAQVALYRLIGLDPTDGHLGIKAHARTTVITTKAAATSA
jgi:hypothetical protein